jgi:hypothetical protein
MYACVCMCVSVGVCGWLGIVCVSVNECMYVCMCACVCVIVCGVSECL